MTIKITSWNVNGLRAIHRKNLWQNFLSLQPDIICLQEIKAHPEQITEDEREIQGFQSFWHPSTAKKGYSGVATYVKQNQQTTVLSSEKEIGITKFDQEGRMLTLHFKNFTLCNVYFPNGGMGPERLKYKLEFYDAFLNYIENIKKTQPNIIFCGDVNTAHNEIDLARPQQNENNTGFLQEERAWIDEVIAHGYVDIYRHLNPERAGAYTYWDLKTRARDRNVGWRIDYFFISEHLLPFVKNAEIHSSIYGSDHCPISIDISI